MAFLLIGPESFSSPWREIFHREIPHLVFHDRVEEIYDLKDVHYLATWDPPKNVAALFPNLQMIISLGAGAEQFVQLELPDRVQIARSVTSGITLMVRDYAVLGVLALHRELPRFLEQRKTASSEPGTVIPASHRRVGIMGLGETGLAVVEALKVFGFPLYGWSRNQKNIDGVYTSFGRNGLDPFLRHSDILVCLLPLTPETSGMLDSDLFAKLPKGGGLVHVGRGKQLQHPALLEALESGQLSAAFVDVTDPEPLPADHAFWSHPKIILTPHIAAQTDPTEAAIAAVECLKCHLAGKPIKGLVNRSFGY